MKTPRTKLPRWSRRAFLTSALASVGALAVARNVHAQSSGSSNRDKVVVVVFLRGAMDGIMALQPLDDSHLATHRPNLLMRSQDVREIGRFGLHPSLSPLGELYDAGELSFIHGVAGPSASRSHFDAQAFMEAGLPERASSEGFLTRVQNLVGVSDSPVQAISISGAVPAAFYGSESVVAATDLTTVRVGRGDAYSNIVSDRMAHLYDGVGHPALRSASEQAFAAMDTLDVLSGAELGSGYPSGPFGTGLSQLAHLIRQDVGVELGFVELGGWDTHVNQGTTDGVFANNARQLADGLAAFRNDLGDRMDDVVVITMTEFGRTVVQNGSSGSDHGRGSVAMVMGGGVAGGQVLGDVPELAVENMDEGTDVPLAVDYRDVVSEVLDAHLGIGAGVFPGHDARRVGVM